MRQALIEVQSPVGASTQNFYYWCAAGKICDSWRLADDLLAVNHLSGVTRFCSCVVEEAWEITKAAGGGAPAGLERGRDGRSPKTIDYCGRVPKALRVLLCRSPQSRSQEGLRDT